MRQRWEMACGIAVVVVLTAGVVAAVTHKTEKGRGAAPAATTTTLAPRHSLTVKTYEYSYDVGQLAALRVVAGRVPVSVQNAGGERHEARFVRLRPGVTVAAVVAGLQHDPSGASLSAVTSVGGTGALAPGARGRAVLNIVPGNYLMFCSLRASDGTPHFAKGMLLPFTVQ